MSYEDTKMEVLWKGDILFGCLYLCATPIGNLEDITLRCLRTLEKVDLIAAEDTRRTIKLLNHYEISKSMISYHEHNKRTRGGEILKLLKEGKDIALVTDAGMPCISDPGEELVKLCVEEDIEVISIPGVSASLAALSISGLSTRYFSFEGFLPVKGRKRRERLNSLKDESRTIIIYESPYRILSTLKDLHEVLGDRNISVSRELTKKYEETIRGDIKSVIKEFSDRSIKGEFVLIIQGKTLRDLCSEEDFWEGLGVEDHIRYHMNKGLSKKQSISLVAKERKTSKREVYKIGIGIEGIDRGPS